MVLPSSCKEDKFKIWVARSIYQETLSDSKRMSRYSFIKMKVDYIVVDDWWQVNKNQEPFMKTTSSFCSVDTFYSKMLSKPKMKLHADSYASTFISCSSARTSLSVDGAQNKQPVLWSNLAKAKLEDWRTADHAHASCFKGAWPQKLQTHSSKAQTKPSIKYSFEGWQSK